MIKKLTVTYFLDSKFFINSWAYLPLLAKKKKSFEQEYLIDDSHSWVC